MSRPIKIAYTGDTSDLIVSNAKAEAAMESTAATAKTAGQKIKTSFDTAGSAADGMASTTSQVAGGLGDLAGGLAATGLISEETAAKMETASAAIMGVTGVSDLANAAFEKFKLGTLASKAATIAHTAATTAQTAAQKALNLAMRANPIGIIITLIAALVAGIVVAYHKNEAFRELVNRVWSKIKDLIDAGKTAVVNFASAVVEKFQTAGAKFSDLRDRAAEAIGSYKDGGGGVLGKLWSMVDTIGGLGAKITAKAAGMWDGISGSFKGVLNDMIGWWNNLSFHIDIPDKIPGLPDSFTISTPNIPMLGSGGIVTRPTLAIIGETGPEAVIPLSQLGGGGNYYHIEVLAPVGSSSEDIGRALVGHIRAFETAGGRRPA